MWKSLSHWTFKWILTFLHACCHSLFLVCASTDISMMRDSNNQQSIQQTSSYIILGNKQNISCKICERWLLWGRRWEKWWQKRWPLLERRSALDFLIFMKFSFDIFWHIWTLWTPWWWGKEEFVDIYGFDIQFPYIWLCSQQESINLKSRCCQL